ncbi:stalk domain-containing protein [Paenibacillus puerhi]|uniref:stalk domain-containing protein n=1 Tax=Paenibacillus puerhi TaxID=2692622 RepID=UPI0019162291|nr:stalk domain-containing protein [Paenibacillus puerhi]
MSQAMRKLSVMMVVALLMTAFSSIAASAAASEKRIQTEQGGYVTLTNVVDEIHFADEGAGVGDTIFVAHGPVTITIHGEDPHPSISFRPDAKLSGDYFDIGEGSEEIPVTDLTATVSKPGYYAGHIRFTSEYAFSTVAQFAIQIVAGSSAEATAPQAEAKPESKTEETAAAKPAAGSAAAQPIASKVLVNGKETAFEAYNINDNNYFKLRDLAMAVNGTEKQFEVSWDASKNAISLESGKAYTPEGGELAVSANPAAKEAASTDSQIYLNGREVQLTAYNIDGNNYLKLRDVAKALNIGVTWDGQTNSVGIDTKVDYKDE